MDETLARQLGGYGIVVRLRFLRWRVAAVFARTADLIVVANKA
jgi:hypothetical protein